MKIERPRLRGCVFLSVVRRTSVRRGDRFFPGTLFQDRHRRPQAAGEPESQSTLTYSAILQLFAFPSIFFLPNEICLIVAFTFILLTCNNAIRSVL